MWVEAHGGSRDCAITTPLKRTLSFSPLSLSLSLFIYILFPPGKVRKRMRRRRRAPGELLVTIRPRNNESHFIATSFYLTYSSNRKPASYHEVGHAVRELKTLSQA
jgi:hypothetical protein